jgi:hypothetical protein
MALHEVGDRAPHRPGKRQVLRFRDARKLGMISCAHQNAQANARLFAFGRDIPSVPNSPLCDDAFLHHETPSSIKEPLHCIVIRP